jgi:hypothetical protein
MPAVKTFFESTLLVVPLSSNLKVASAAGALSAASSITIEASDRDTGFSGSDYLIYYSATETSECTGGTSDALAYAAAFEVTECDRPLVGYIHFCPSGLTTTDTNTAQHATQLSTAKHEMTHAFGFAARHYAYWRTTGMAARTSRDDSNGVPNLGPMAVSLSENGNDALSPATFEIFKPDEAYFQQYTDSTLGGTRWKFKSDKIVEKARTHFGCTTLDGVEVENQGSSGSWGSHWEKRIIGNEFMSAIANEMEYPVSEITLASYEDMGWWGVDYNQADSYPWMKNAGCNTITQKCITDSTPVNSDYFCNNESSVHQCTFDGAAVGYCNKGTASGLASYYYYFGDTSTAGSLLYADYCPTVSHFSNRICSGVKADGTAITGTNTELAQGAEYSSNSRCFMSSLYQTAYSYVAKTAACYKYQCLSTSQLEINLYYSNTQNFTQVCSTATAGQSFTVPNFAGSITCIDPADITVCGSDTSFPTLSNMTVVSGATDMTAYLTPPFDTSITSYRMNIGADYSSFDITPTTTSTSAVTLVFADRAGTETTDGPAPTPGTAYTTALQPNYNTFSFKLTTTAGQERKYTVGVTRGTGDNSTKTIQITLGLVYSSITDMAAFRTAITAELVDILEIQDTSQIELFQVTEGSVKVQFILKYKDSASPEPYALDATLLSLFDDKNSVMFDDKYTYLKWATLYGSTSSVNYCNTVENTCTNEYCNVETGVCSNSGGDDDDFPDWALYACIGVGVLLGACILFFLVKKIVELCCPNCCKSSQPLDETKEEEAVDKAPVFPPIDREAGKKEHQIRLDETAPPATTGKGGKFSAMMNDDSSDDEAQAGQI